MSYCQSYQPLPISTGTSGLDRCGNVVAYAAPSVVQAPVGWGCWPIQCQQPGWPPGPTWSGGWTPGWSGGGGWWPWWWWGASGGIDPGFTAPPWWGASWPMPVRTDMRQAAITQGTQLANWMIAQRQRGATPAAQRAA